MFKTFSRKLKHSIAQILQQLAHNLEVDNDDDSLMTALEGPGDFQNARAEEKTFLTSENTKIEVVPNSGGETNGNGRREMLTSVNIQNLENVGSGKTTAAVSSSQAVGTNIGDGGMSETEIALDSNLTEEKDDLSKVTIKTPVKSKKSEKGSRRRRRRKNRREKSTPKSCPQLVPMGKGLKAFGQSLHKFSQQPRFWLVLGFGMGAGVGTSALVWGFYQLETMTQVAIADVVTYAPAGTMTIKAGNGAILQEIGNVSHDKLEIGKIPPLIEEAFIASEDSRFREHRGIDPQGILRASVSNVQSGDVVQGASTITQQLARLVFLTQDRTLVRKVKEVRLAQKIETNLPKDQILERYLNLIYLGSGAYGVADAAYAYFSKAPEDLTLGEAATLAGVVPAPSVYSPRQNLELATRRRNEVLNRMAEVGFISPAEAEAAIAEPLKLNPSPLKRFNREAEFFTDYILDELKTKLSAEQLQSGGLTVNTTLNDQWQKDAQKILTDTVNKYGKWQRFSEGAMVAVDPRTGAIKMMVGGKDYESSQFNRVTQAKRQPGSTFKPILYATAIASGISPNKSYPNVPIDIGGYRPENYGDSYSGGNMSLRDALTRSVNVVAVRLLLDVGWNPVIGLARKMGITSKIEPTYSLALGSWEMTPLEMTSAYGTFANQGTHVQPYAIQNVVNPKGEVIYKAEHQQTRALDEDSNAIMTSMMRSVVTSGTGRPAQLGDRQVAGKTGTSDEAKDLWFIGYIPQLVTGVWLGNDNSLPTRGASTTAAIAWGEFMRTATKGMAVESFPAMPKNPDRRKPSIKAEPIKRKVRTLAPPSPPEAPSQNNNNQQATLRRRSQQASNNQTNNAPVRSSPTVARQSDPAPQSASQNSGGSRATANTAPTAPVAAPAPQATPAGGGLPAPPAARKSE